MGNINDMIKNIQEQAKKNNDFSLSNNVDDNKQNIDTKNVDDKKKKPFFVMLLVSVVLAVAMTLSIYGLYVFLRTAHLNFLPELSYIDICIIYIVYKLFKIKIVSIEG